MLAIVPPCKILSRFYSHAIREIKVQRHDTYRMLLLYIQLKLDATRDSRGHSKLLGELSELLYSTRFRARGNLHRPEALE